MKHLGKGLRVLAYSLLKSICSSCREKLKCFDQSAVRMAIFVESVQNSKRKLAFIKVFVKAMKTTKARSRKCVSQSEASEAIFVNRSARKTQTCLISCQVLFKFMQKLQ